MIYQQPFLRREVNKVSRKRENQESNKVRGRILREHTAKEGNKFLVPILQECLKIIVSKVCGVSVQMLSQIGAAVVWISEMTLCVKGLSYTGVAVTVHLKQKNKTRYYPTMFQPF